MLFFFFFFLNPASGITVQIRNNGAAPILEQSYFLNCEVTGTRDSISTYQWQKDDTVLSETGPILSFSSLRLSDAGQYTCQVTVNGTVFNHSQNIRLTS